jgi:mRNA interferase MazF
VIAGNLARASVPGNVLVKAAESGLPRDSVVSVYQIVTLDKTFLDSCVSVLPEDVMLQVDQGIKLVLDLW